MHNIDIYGNPNETDLIIQYDPNQPQNYKRTAFRSMMTDFNVIT